MEQVRFPIRAQAIIFKTCLILKLINYNKKIKTHIWVIPQEERDLQTNSARISHIIRNEGQAVPVEVHQGLEVTGEKETIKKFIISMVH